MFVKIIILNLFFTFIFLTVAASLFVRKDNLNKSILLKSFISGILSAIVYIAFSFIVLSIFRNTINLANSTSLFVLAASEEILKAVFILYLMKKIGSLKMQQLILISTGIGLGFSLIENTFYYSYFIFGEISNSFIIVRSLLVPLMHIVSTSIFGCFVFIGRKKHSYIYYAFGLLLASTIHFLWNILA